MPTIANPTLLGIGLFALLIGIWLWRWSSRRVIDLKGAALGAAWQGARTRQMPDMPDEIKSRLQEVAGQSTHSGKAMKAARIGAGHYVGVVVGLFSYVFLLGGLGLIAAGVWWK